MTIKQLAKITAGDFLDRHFIGYNQIIDDFRNFNPVTTNFPPFNVIEVSEEEVDIELAVAGFKPSDISVTVERGILSITGDQTVEEAEVEEEKVYRYRGISTRAFSRSYRLAEYWEVADASFDNGILTVKLALVIPEAEKPKTIEIKTS